MTRIPLVVLGGFLGAGKTTLLNHLLTASSGLRVAALVNDFGPINVDAGLIAAHDGDTLSLTNGCICCSMGSGLEDALIRVLGRSPAPDLIVIEASGVSDPGRIAQVGMSDPMLQLEAVVVLVDAPQVLAQLDDTLMGDTLERQIGAASLLVLNKSDVMDAAEMDATQQALQARFGQLPVIWACFGRVPLAQLLQASAATSVQRSGTTEPYPSAQALAEQAVPAAGAGRGHSHAGRGDSDHDHSDHDHGAHDHGDHGHGGQAHTGHTHGGRADDPEHPFESGLWQADGILDADQLAQALRRLPRTIIRVKGWVVTDRHGQVIVHLAGGRVRFERLPEGHGAAGNELVYIGLRGSNPGEAMGAALDSLSRETSPAS